MLFKLELPAIKEARLQVLRDNLNKIKMEFVADTIISGQTLLHFGTANWVRQYNQRSKEAIQKVLLI
jgi:hypothetical protein